MLLDLVDVVEMLLDVVEMLLDVVEMLLDLVEMLLDLVDVVEIVIVLRDRKDYQYKSLGLMDRYDDGQIKSEGNYQAGIKDGKWVEYSDDGQTDERGRVGRLKSEGNYVDGKEEGKWVIYDETGNLIDEDTYREGLCIESCEWRKTYGIGTGYSVQQTVDGGFIVTGFDPDGVLLLKTDGQGNEEWRKTLGEGGGYSVQKTVDGGFIVTGYDGFDDVFLLKTNELGNI